MRGEHQIENGRQLTVSGSSPHARGARVGHDIDGVGAGIIPACAGSTNNFLSGGEMEWDHPRMRGEHRQSRDLRGQGLGSSPHARGARQGWSLRPGAGGIIPACAGSTQGDRRRRCLSRDHPRMRGEHPRSFCSFVSL